MSPLPYLLFELPTQLPDTTADSIVSRTFYSGPDGKAILFTFAPGQELSQHTASVPAIIHILKGEGSLTVGGNTFAAREGVWVHLDAHLPHSVQASTPLVMLLLMLKNP